MIIQNTKYPASITFRRASKIQNIVLIGLRGSGKTTLGKMIATRLGYNFLDTDQVIEQNSGCKIKEMVEKNGWEYFREKERKLIIEIRDMKRTIIATGGGIIINQDNIIDLKENGILVYLKTPIEILKARLKNNLNRPALKGENVLAEIELIYQERAELYQKNADYTYEKRDLDFSEVDIDNILKLIQQQTIN